MATGFRLSNGLDLDQVFAARVTTAAANVGFRNSAGTDLSQLFEKLPGTSAAVTGYRTSAGADLNTIFSATAGVPQNFSTSGSGFAISPSATCTVTVQRDGNVTATDGATVAWHTSAPATTIGDAYQVKFEHTGGTGGVWGGVAYSTWYALTTNRAVSLSENTLNESTSGQVQIAIRRASDLVQVCTGTVNVSAEVSNV